MTRSKWLAIAGVVVIAVVWWRGGGGDDDARDRARATDSARIPDDEAAKLLLDRNWLDLWPDDERQRLHVYRFVPSMGGGVFQDRTLYKGTFELFQFEVDGDRIHFHLPHDELRMTARFAMHRVDGPPPFDLRLTFDSSPRGPAVYYASSRDGSRSLEDWWRAERAER